MEDLQKGSRLSETSDDDDGEGHSYHQYSKRFKSNNSFAGSTSEGEQDLHLGDDGESSDPESTPFAQRMMKKMGYIEGHGLGKNQQGRVNPVEISQQKGRRGLGHSVPKLDAATSEYDPSLEIKSVEEIVTWLSNEHELNDTLNYSLLQEWLSVGKKKKTINDEDKFCDTEILHSVLSAKSIFDDLGGEEMRKARTRSNPFELIRGVFFLNRAAMKMANMDKVFDFMFTNPKDANDHEMVGPHELLYFADVCAGPGGFSEYVLWRRKWCAKGFGFTLKAENDFKLDDFFAAPCETFEPLYGVKDDGDVFDPDNIMDFTQYVLQKTEGAGVHFMMADGGFSVDGQENIQEILSKQLYLCQCIVALNIVRTKGNFVVKLFDLFTPFSVGLIYLMYRSFHKISIHKPNTSRPANSERYLICKHKRKDCHDIAEHLFSVNKKLAKMGEVSAEDITELVPFEQLTGDEDFYNYIVNSNNSLGQRQVQSLLKIAAYCKNTELIEEKQQDLRKECLKYWDIPDKARTAPLKCKPLVKFEELLSNGFKQSDLVDSINKKVEELDPKQVGSHFQSVFDWHCVVLGSIRDNNKDDNSCAFYLGLGRNNVYKQESYNVWRKVETMNIELPPNTLVYGEIVQELNGNGRSQLKTYVFHIIDAVFLGGEDIRKKHITERWKRCSLLAKALHKKNNLIRMKVLYDLVSLDQLLDSLDLRTSKSGRPCLGLPLEDATFFRPSGIMLLNGTNPPWMRALSFSTGYTYYAHPTAKNTFYDRDRPPEAVADFKTCYERRLVWWWEDGVVLHPSQQCQPDPTKLQASAIVSYVHRMKSEKPIFSRIK